MNFKKINLQPEVDYQWPSSLQIIDDLKNNKLNLDLLAEIEDFFRDKFKTSAVVFPSARAGISAIFRYKNLSRKNFIYTSPWVSKCVFDVIGEYANPNTLSPNGTDFILAVHKWGYEYKIPEVAHQNIIEDSVDSFILDKDALFPNKSEFEVLSLPKLIGTLSGGVVVTTNSDFLNFARKLQQENNELSIWQWNLKKGHMNNTFHHWHFLENKNFSMGESELMNIKSALKNYNLAQDIILKRLEILESRLSPDCIIFDRNKRVGPVLPLSVEKFSEKSPNLLMKRQFSFENDLRKLNFQTTLLLPLHFGVNDSSFEMAINNLSY